MFMFKKRKKESVAIPFLISMIITLVIVGIPAGKYYQKMLENRSKANNAVTALSYKPTEKNDNTILLAANLSVPNEAKDKIYPKTVFCILRTSPVKNKFTFISVSNDTLYNQQKLSNIYTSSGIIDLKNAVEEIYDIKIDRYLSLKNEGVTTLCDWLGGVNYEVPENLKGLNDGQQYLSAEFIIKLLGNKRLNEEARSKVNVEVLSEMINQTTGPRVADALDYTFTSIVNCSESNITKIDFDNQQAALNYMFDSGKFFAEPKVISGETTKDGFTPDKSSINKIKKDLGI